MIYMYLCEGVGNIIFSIKSFCDLSQMFTWNASDKSYFDKGNFYTVKSEPLYYDSLLGLR